MRLIELQLWQNSLLHGLQLSTMEGRPTLAKTSGLYRHPNRLSDDASDDPHNRVLNAIAKILVCYYLWSAC